MDERVSGSITASEATTVLVHADGRVELSGNLDLLEASPLYNEDLAPLPVSRRNWTTYNYAALWGAMCACIPTYMISSGLIASGMNWWQALLTIVLGNSIVLVPILLNSHPGTKYGIPFPVFARASYGTAGSNLPALMRAAVACGWFGIQSWIGGQALFGLVNSLIPNCGELLGGESGGHKTVEWLCFGLFWGLNMLIVCKGMDLLKKFQGVAAPFVLLMTAALLFWALSRAHGLGALLHDNGKFQNPAEFLRVFVPALTGMIGFWATLSLNMPDFTRFGHSQREQSIGQAVALPLSMAVFSAMGVMITSAAIVIYPEASMKELWDPVKLINRFDNPLVIAVAMFTVGLATLSVNIAANVVSPANDFANAFPKWISFQRGAFITGIAGVFFQPWKLVDNPNSYIFSWLVGYSGGLGSIAGVLIVDYWIIRRRELKLPDLYLQEGEYAYSSGWNPAAVIATLGGCFAAWIGAFYPPLSFLYDYGWFLGLIIAGSVYYLLMKNCSSKAKL